MNNFGTTNPPVTPFETNTPQAGSGYTAALDYSLAVQTEALWTRFSGSSRSFAWPSPNDAPAWSSSTFDSWSNWVLDIDAGATEVYELPWYLQKGFDSIVADVIVAVPNTVEAEFQMRMETVQMKTTLTPEQSLPVGGMQVPYTQLPAIWGERYDGIYWRLLRFKTGIRPSSISGDRIFALSFESRVVNTSGLDPGGSVTINRQARMVSLMVRDYPIEKQI